jgi:hypothetical protein
MSDSKILLTYINDDGNIQMESVWATKEGDYYRINNMPFLAPNIALNDLISVEEDDGALYFDSLVQPSGHSTIQIIFFDEKIVMETGREFEHMGCTWEGSHLKTLISVDIPKEINYKKVKEYLDKGENECRWSYKEACLCHEY